MTRLFFMNLGITCLAVIILYLYFRNKFGKMEQKVDLMFQLIQEFNQKQNIERTMVFRSPEQPTMTHGEKPDDLISVSDDDDRDSDSDEVSDNEDNTDALNIASETLASTIKSINLAGAEIDSMYTEAPDDLDEVSELDEEDNIITLAEVNEFQNEMKEEVDTNKDENDDDTVTHFPEHQIENITKVDPAVKQVNVIDNKPLSTYSVKELKQKCQDEGFTNYKALRKNKLIELLEKNPIVENNI